MKTLINKNTNMSNKIKLEPSFEKMNSSRINNKMIITIVIAIY